MFGTKWAALVVLAANFKTPFTCRGAFTGLSFPVVHFSAKGTLPAPFGTERFSGICDEL
jgi:hypothetical protein